MANFTSKQIFELYYRNLLFFGIYINAVVNYQKLSIRKINVRINILSIKKFYFIYFRLLKQISYFSILIIKLEHRITLNAQALNPTNERDLSYSWQSIYASLIYGSSSKERV